MKVSTQNATCVRRFGDDRALQLLSDAGFECMDYTFHDLPKGHPFYDENAFRPYFAQLRQKAESMGVSFNQSHAQFSHLHIGDDEWNNRVQALGLRALEASGILGIKVCVIHPQMANALTLDEEYEINMEYYHGLLPYCEEYGVKVGVENMWKYNNEEKHCYEGPCASLADYSRYMKGLDPKWFVACLDLGHGDMRDTGDDAVTLIRGLGSRIEALHVHDNDLVHDLHTIPYLGKMDWEAISDALKEIGYHGDFTFEADNFLTQFPDGLIGPAMKLMSEVGHYIVRRYDL